MLVEDNSKKFEKPDSGEFLGTVIDVVDLGKVPSKYGLKSKLRIVWVLDKNDSEGNPYRVMRTLNATVSSGGPRPSDLYNIAKDILGRPPAVPFETDELIGKSNKLFIIKEGEYANIKGILPLPAGAVPPSVPAGFVRAKDRQGYAPVQQAATSATTAPAPAVAPAVSQAVASTQPSEVVKF